MKKIRKFMLLLAAVLVLYGGISLVISRPYLFYIAGEFLGIDCSRKESVIEDILDTEITLEQLKKDKRVTMNQSMMLVNTEYKIPDDFIPDISEYKTSGVEMSNCMKYDYEQLSLSVTDHTGDALYVSSHFRTSQKQQALYKEDPKTAAQPGTSEHQTGLALDVYVGNYSGFGFIQSEAGQYVNSNAWKYGFIIRYPSFGTKETGIKYEPWHIRYVGYPHAEIIYNNHMTLEEYILSMQKNIWYTYGDYMISRQSLTERDTVKIPSEYSELILSPDNTGSYIITACN